MTILLNTPESWTERANTIKESFEACAWSEESQMRRFTAIRHALAPRSGETLLDYGCGTGEFFYYLPSDVRYCGYDWASGMIARAIDEHPSGHFTQHEPLGDFDLIVCCGPFNLSHNWSKDQTWQTITRLWARTGRALAVALNSHADPAIANLAYNDEECSYIAGILSDDWSVTRWRPEDILLVMNR